MGTKIILNSSGANISTADLTQTDLNRIYTRSAISGVSRLRFQGTSHVLTMEDSSTIVMYSSKYDTGGTATPTTALSGSKLEFNGGTCRIQGAGSELRLYGYYNTTIESKINLSADLEITSKSTRKTIMNANILRWESSDSVTHYGNINNGKFIWATGTGFLPPTVVGSEGFSVQKDMLVKGSDNSVNTSGFKITDINNNSLLDVKNSGRFATNGSNVNSAFNVAYDGTSNNSFTVSSANIIHHALNAQSYTIRNTAGTQDLFKFNVQSGVSKLVLSTTAGSNFLNLQTGTDGYYARKININSATASHSKAVIQLNQNSANISQQLFFANITMTTSGRTNSSSSFGTAEKGFECFDTDKNKKFFWNGSAWEKIKGNTESVSVASATTVTPNIDISEMEIVSALASALTIAVPTGVASSFFEGKELTFRIKDNGTARALTWNAIFVDYTGILPTTTVASKTVYIGCKYNVVDTKWDVVAVQVQP